MAGAGDALVGAADADMLRSVEAYLAAYPAMRYWAPYGGGPDQLRGRIALKFDRVDEAEVHFRTGLEWTQRPEVRLVIEEGRCYQGLAEVAERRGDHALALQHLEAAGALFARSGAKLYLDQVLAKKEILRA